jgi:hypothetical protein
MLCVGNISTYFGNLYCRQTNNEKISAMLKNTTQKNTMKFPLTPNRNKDMNWIFLMNHYMPFKTSFRIAILIVDKERKTISLFRISLQMCNIFIKLITKVTWFQFKKPAINTTIIIFVKLHQCFTVAQSHYSIFRQTLFLKYWIQ